MQLTIHIDNQEIQDIIDTLKEQGMDVTSAEVQSHIEDYIQGAIHDSRHERMDCVVDSLLDLQDWFLYTDRMKNKEQLEQPINVYIKSQNPSNEDQYIKNLMERRRKAFYEESKLDRSFRSSHTGRMQNKNNEELAENTGEFVDWLLDTVRDRMHKCAMINDRKSMGVLLELLNDIEDKLAEE